MTYNESRGQSDPSLFILAHQVIAARLNARNGASCWTEGKDISDEAKDLLEMYEWDLELPKGMLERVRTIELYEILDAYNNGVMGPGHCPDRRAFSGCP